MDGLLLIAGLFFFLFLYFMPAYFAYRRDHPQRHWILVCNLFAGATVIVWIICIIWALTYNAPQESEPEA
jgi:uncharacterized membrane-anchored protein